MVSNPAFGCPNAARELPYPFRIAMLCVQTEQLGTSVCTRLEDTSLRGFGLVYKPVETCSAGGWKAVLPCGRAWKGRGAAAGMQHMMHHRSRACGQRPAAHQNSPCPGAAEGPGPYLQRDREEKNRSFPSFILFYFIFLLPGITRKRTRKHSGQHLHLDTW